MARCDIIIEVDKTTLERKDENQMKNKEHKSNVDKGKIFVKIMAGILAVLMLAGTGITLVYALMA